MKPEPVESDCDSAIAALCLVARVHHVAADPAHIRHEFGTGSFTSHDVVRAARTLGLKARAVALDAGELAHAPLPCIARLEDGSFVVVAGVSADAVLVKAAGAGPPESIASEDFIRAWRGEVVLVTRRAAPATGAGVFDFAWFVPFILKYRRYFVDVLAASFVLQLFALVTPLFFQVVVDKVLVHRGLTTLDVLALGLLLVSSFDVVLAGMRHYVFAHTSHRIDVALGAALFRHLLHLPLAYFRTRRVGDTVARVRELETIRQFLTGSSLTLVVDSLFTVVFFAVLIVYSPLLTMVVVMSLPLYVVLACVITPLLRRRLHEKFHRGADSQAYLVETVTGIETLKSSAVEPAMQRRWEERLAAYVKASFRAGNLANVANQVAGFINKLMVVGILWLGARLVINGQLTVGQLVAFNMIAGRIAGPLLRIVQLWQDYQQAGIAVTRLGDILNAPTEPAHDPSRGTLPVLRGQVTLDRVTFRYTPGAREVLKDVSVSIDAHEVIGIVGRSGCGKSTFAKLVQRLYVPERGRVFVDGVDLALIDSAWLRRRIGVVLQESVLFNRSVRENIALSDPTTPLEMVIDAARLAGAHEFIVELPRGYDTMLGEYGSNLSGGQRQRIAIARALVTNPAIVIFDEATSALDYESEAVIMRNMAKICRNRTVVIVAHRLSSVRHADRILVLDAGRIVETGSHAELVRGNGYYARMHRLQAEPGGGAFP